MKTMFISMTDHMESKAERMVDRLLRAGVIICMGALLVVGLTGCAAEKVRPDYDHIEQARAEARPISLSCVGTHIHRRCRADQQYLAKPYIQTKTPPSPMNGKKR